jgi:DNA-binding CsgD family transcriptional regulator/tetratricopeptide (TPR) repeat protein
MDRDAGRRVQVASDMSNLGILNWYKKKYDTALRYDFDVVALYLQLGDMSEVARTYTNIALVYQDLHQYLKAVEYNERALETYKEVDDPVSAGLCRSNLGDIYTRIAKERGSPVYKDSHLPDARGLLKKALLYFDSAIVIQEDIGDIYNLLSSYKYKAIAAELAGDYPVAYRSLQLYKSYNDSVFSLESKVKLANIETEHELQLRQKQIELKKLELAKNENERWFFVASIIMLLAIGILVFNRQRLRQKKLQAEKQNAEAELNNAQKLLDNFRQSVLEKNNMLEQFAGEISALKNVGTADVNEEVLAKLQQSTILTDEQWEEFRVLFEKVHKGFFRRVKEKMPDLTFTEIRFLALSKLKLSPREMASMLGISAGSIRNYRMRLRRKLGLDEEASIEELADSV